MQIEKLTVLNVLKNINSGIGLDVSKNHTGIVIWDGTDLKEYGFEIKNYDKSDYFAEYKMRRDFKNSLKEIVNGKYFEYCIIEDVYGGENFDTVRKLLALNTVIDELIFDRVCFVDTFVRWSEPTWLAGFRLLHKEGVKLKAKLETQTILEYLQYDFYLKNKDLSNPEKKKIFFEDICDACGMLLSVVAKKSLEKDLAKEEKLTISNVKLSYIENQYDAYKSRDKYIKRDFYKIIDLSSSRNLEKDILNYATIFPNDVLCAEIPVSKLGNFGIKHKFKFFESGIGYLFFYNKKAFKNREESD